MHDVTRIALIGGIYSNYHALVATLADIDRRGADSTFFLGDLGAFGPHPDRIPSLLIEQYALVRDLRIEQTNIDAHSMLAERLKIFFDWIRTGHHRLMHVRHLCAEKTRERIVRCQQNPESDER